MYLSEIIKTAREAKGMTQEQLAHLMNVTQTTVWRWEGGDGVRTGVPRIHALKPLSEALDLDYDDLLAMTVQASADRAAARAVARDERTMEQWKLRVVQASKRDGTPANTGADGRGPSEDRIARLEGDVRVLLERLGRLAQALVDAGVFDYSEAWELGELDEPGATPLQGPPSSDATPQRPPQRVGRKRS